MTTTCNNDPSTMTILTKILSSSAHFEMVPLKNRQENTTRVQNLDKGMHSLPGFLNIGH